MRLYHPVSRGRPSETWWLDATEGKERLRVSLGTADRAVAEARAHQHLDRVRRSQVAEALGVETHERARGASIDDLLLEYSRELEHRGVTPRWRRLTIHRAGRLLELMGAASLADVTAERIKAALPLLHRGSRTQGFYIQAIGGLFRWLCAEGRWSHDPTPAVRRPRIVEGARRRALSPDELAALLAVAPPHRALIYLVASTTGLRREEMDTLRWADLDLDAARLEVRAERAKSRRAATLPIIERTLSALEAHRATPWAAAGDVQALRGSMRAQWAARIAADLALPPLPRPATLRRDLRRSGVTWSEGDDILDLHALRVTFVTSLLRSGASLAQAQRLARHSDPRTTAAHYARLDTSDDREAADALGRLLDVPLAVKDEERPGNHGLRRQARA